MTIQEYLIKFSAGITVAYLFYAVFLRQLTFYQWNRFYLLGYGLLAFILPFINVTPWISENRIDTLPVVDRIPPVNEVLGAVSSDLNAGEWLLILFVTGFAIGIIRLSFQFYSYKRLQRRSVLLHQQGNVRIFQSAKIDNAFSFGSDIYVNTDKHTSEELEKIMLHEIVHVRQQHSTDIIAAELICIVNWFNPFAWMMRNAIRQNLEYIADSHVLAHGFDRKQYQYLLLKVSAGNDYHVGAHFNFSGIKKRIAMMNKIKSAKVHLAKFFFILPLISVILLAFRTGERTDESRFLFPIITDTVPADENAVIEPVQVKPKEGNVHYNDRGYSLSVIATNGETVILIRQKNNPSLTAMTMKEWNNNRQSNETKYGKLPPAPAPVPAPPVPPAPKPVVDPHPPVAPVAPVAPVPPVAPVVPEQTLQNATTKQEEQKVQVQIRQNVVEIQNVNNVTQKKTVELQIQQNINADNR